MTDTVLTTESDVAVKDPDRNWKIARNCLLEGGVYLAVFLVTAILCFTLKPLINYYRAGVVAKCVMAVALGACIVFIAYMGATKRLKTRHIILLILAVGYIMRVGYMLYTPAGTRQHDTYSSNYNGHEAYAWTIFETGALPTHNEYQFYHPPLNAMIQAWFMRMVNGFTSLFKGNWFPDAFSYGSPTYTRNGKKLLIVDNQRYFLYGSCQILSVLYSFITAVTLMKIIKLFHFSEKNYLFLSGFAVLFPRHIQFAGMLNNDPLSYMFAMLALYFALRWWKGNKSLVYIILCAFAVGLGMMAKLSSATICLPIAGIFIYEFIRTLRKKEGALSLLEMIAQYGIFLCICAPIGLWFQVYAHQRFGQEFGSVFSKLNSKLYTGDESIWGRFGITFNLNEYFASLFCRPFEDTASGLQGNYNLFNYLVKSSIFGEFSYWNGEGFGLLALLFAYMGTAFLTIGVIWCIVLWWKKTKASEGTTYAPSRESVQNLLFIFLLVASQIFSEMYFYAKMPYACTMDFRYILPLILGIALAVGTVGETLVSSGGALACKFTVWLYILAGGLIVSSTLFYCVCI